jgi:hypothetical protein
VRARARGEAVGIHEILRVRAQPQCEPVDVARDGCRTLRRQATVDEVPGEVLLDEVHAEQVAQPRQNLRRTGILDLRDAVAERLPLQQLAVRTRRLDQLGLVRVEEGRRLGGDALDAGAVAPRCRRSSARRDPRAARAAARRSPARPSAPSSRSRRPSDRVDAGPHRGRPCLRSASRRTTRASRHPRP